MNISFTALLWLIFFLLFLSGEFYWWICVCIGPPLRFFSVSDFFIPKDDGRDSQLFISQTYDATTHFETTCLDVLDVYRRGTGDDFDFSKVRHDLGDEEQ